MAGACLNPQPDEWPTNRDPSQAPGLDGNFNTPPVDAPEPDSSGGETSGGPSLPIDGAGGSGAAGPGAAGSAGSAGQNGLPASDAGVPDAGAEPGDD